LDTGPMLARRALPVGAEETAGALFERLASLGADLLVETLPRWLRGEIVPEPQDEALATPTRPLTKEDGRLGWTRPAEYLARQVRAYTPWPGAFTTWNGRQLKVLRAHALDSSHAADAPGQCSPCDEEAVAHLLCCASGQGALALEVIQLEGRKA